MTVKSSEDYILECLEFLAVYSLGQFKFLWKLAAKKVLIKLTCDMYFDIKIKTNMNYKDKTKEQLINELAELHQREARPHRTKGD